MMNQAIGSADGLSGFTFPRATLNLPRSLAGHATQELQIYPLVSRIDRIDQSFMVFGFEPFYCLADAGQGLHQFWESKVSGQHSRTHTSQRVQFCKHLNMNPSDFPLAKWHLHFIISALHI